jgi:hypothetical protein
LKTPQILLVTAVLVSTISFAQFTIDGEIRPRFEYRHGYKSVADSNQSNAAFVQQRTRLNFGYKTEGYIFKVTMQYINVWGSEPQLISNYSQLNSAGSYLDFHEAWGQALINNNLSRPLQGNLLFFRNKTPIKTLLFSDLNLNLTYEIRKSTNLSR